MISCKKQICLIIVFSKQYTTIVNNSSIHVNPTFETGNKLSTFEFSMCDIIKAIVALDSKVAHGHDCMLYLKIVWKMNVSPNSGQKKT